MSQTSKIMPTKVREILLDIFKKGNTIALFTTDPNGGRYVEPTAQSYSRYTIKDGDFASDNNGGVYNANHLMFSLAEEAWATSDDPVVAFGVYESSTLIYWGMLYNDVTIAQDTVPVFKKYLSDASDGSQGIKVTLDVYSESTASM